MAITRKRIGGATRDEQGNTTPVGRSGSRPVVGGSIGRNSSTRGGVPAGVAQNDITSNYSDILARLAGSSDNSILQLLQSLGINQDAGLTGPQRDDWNKQLLDTLINYQLTQENRSYNESMRDEQRLYDTPLNQLARLMGAGVSRDAAIQMLSGGSQPIQSDVAVGAEGIAPSESAANGIQAALAPAQLAIDAIGSVGSLISLGFSIPQAIQQTKFLKNQNLLTQKQLRSYDSASSAFSVLNSIGASKEAFGSAGAAIKVISSAAQKGNIQAQRFMSTPEFATLSEEGYFTSRALSQLYQNERSHESYGAYIQHQLSENKFLDLNSRKVISEMALIGAEINNYVESAEFTRQNTALLQFSRKKLIAEAELLQKQGNLVDAQTMRERAAKLNIDAQTTWQTLQNNVEEGAQNQYLYNENGDLESGLSIMSRERCNSAYMAMRRLVAMNDSDMIEKEVNSLALNYDALSSLYALLGAYHSGALDKYNNDPQFADLLDACDAFTQCQGWSYLQQASGGVFGNLFKNPASVNSIMGNKNVRQTLNPITQ